MPCNITRRTALQTATAPMECDCCHEIQDDGDWHEYQVRFEYEPSRMIVVLDGQVIYDGPEKNAT